MGKRLTKSQVSEIIRLANAGFSLQHISENLSIRKSTLYYHAKTSCHKMTKFGLSLITASEKGYLIGLFLGDGSFNKGGREQRFFVRFALDAERDKDVALRIAQIFQKAGKKINFISWKSNTIAKTCSKELVAYIETFIEYREGEKNFLFDKSWLPEFMYGFLAGIIDSDGHVHEHLGTEIKTVSRSIFENILKVLDTLEISANTKKRNAPKNSFSEKPRFEIYIPSAEMKLNINKIPSVKIARCLHQVFSEKH